MTRADLERYEKLSVRARNMLLCRYFISPPEHKGTTYTWRKLRTSYLTGYLAYELFKNRNCGAKTVREVVAWLEPIIRRDCLRCPRVPQFKTPW